MREQHPRLVRGATSQTTADHDSHGPQRSFMDVMASQRDGHRRQ